MQSGILWLLFVLYSVVVVVWSFLTTGKEKNAEEFWSGNRDIAWWKLAVSLASGWLMLGWIGFGMGQVYMLGATGLWILPIPWLVLMVFLAIAVPLYRKVPNYSIADAFEKRFGPGMRVLIGLFSLGVFLSWTGAELVMVKTLVGANLGIEESKQWIVLIIFVVPIMIYTFRGGFHAIINTDLFQFALMALFMVVLLVFALKHTAGSVEGSVMEAIRSSKPPWAPDAPVFGLMNMGIIFPIALFLGYLPGWAIEQDLWLRIQAAKSTADSRKAALLALVLIGTFVIVIPSIVAFLGLAAFPPVDGAEAEAVGGAGNWAVGIIPAFMGHMPAALGCFMFLGIIACQMSTVDTFANVSAMAVANDMMASRGERGRPVARWISVAVLFLAFIYALWADKLGDVYYISSGVLSAAIAVPLFALGWKRARSEVVFVASLAGFFAAIGFYWLEYKVWELAMPSWLGFLSASAGYNYLGACVLASAVVLVVPTLLLPPPKPRTADNASESPGRRVANCGSLESV